MIHKKQNQKNMIKRTNFYKKLCILLAINVILVSFAIIMPFSSKNGIQNKKICDEPVGVSLQNQKSSEEKAWDKYNCLPDSNKNLFTFFILGIINIDDLSMWVLGVDRRLVVLKIMHEKRFIQASDIADSTQRSLQNISYAMRELEEQGLIRCLTPGKHTWKKYLPTEKGTEVFEKLKENHLVN